MRECTHFLPDERIFLGQGVFETLKVRAGRPLFADAHFRRLQQSASALGIAFELDFPAFEKRLLKALAGEAASSNGLKVLVSAGSAPRGYLHEARAPGMHVQAFTYTPQTAPVVLVRAPWQRDAANPLYGHKTVNALENLLAAKDAHARGASDALFFNTKGHATETTTANLFGCSGGILWTPPLNDGVLPGITRSRVFDICKALAIPCEERPVDEQLLAGAEALALTNSLQGMRHVESFNGQAYARFHPLITAIAERL